MARRRTRSPFTSARQRNAPDSLAVFCAIVEKGTQADVGEDKDRADIGNDHLVPLRLTSVASSGSSSSALVRTAGTWHRPISSRSSQRATPSMAAAWGVCPTWSKLYRNGHFGAHFGPKNLRFSGLSLVFKSLLLHQISFVNQRLSARICPIGRSLPSRCNARSVRLEALVGSQSILIWEGIREPASRAIDFLLFERHYRHRRRHVSPGVGRCFKASLRETDTGQLVPQVKPEVPALSKNSGK